MHGPLTGRKQNLTVLDNIVNPSAGGEKSLQRHIERRILQVDTHDPVGIDHFAAVRETQIALLRDLVHHGLQFRPFETERHVLCAETREGQQAG